MEKTLDTLIAQSLKQPEERKEKQSTLDNGDVSPNVSEEISLDYLLKDPQICGYTDTESQMAFYEWSTSGLDLSGKVVLDLGCNRCDFYTFLSGKYTGFRYIGIDNAVAYKEVVSRKYPQFPDNFEMHLANWKDYVPETQVDYVFNIFGFLHELPNMYEEFENNLKKYHEIANIGVIYMLLCNSNEPDSNSDAYFKFEITQLTQRLNNFKFGIDRTMSMGSIKVGIFH